jgi:hypothetical protein
MKPSEIFEGEDSSLRKTFDAAIGCEGEYARFKALHISRAAMLECDEHYMEVVRRAEKRAVEEYRAELRKTAEALRIFDNKSPE